MHTDLPLLAITRCLFFFFASSLFLGSRPFYVFCVVAALPLSFPFAALCHSDSLVVAVLDSRVRRFLLRAFVELRRVLLSVGFLALFPGVCVPVCRPFFCMLHYCLASGWRLRGGFLRTIMATAHCSFKVFFLVLSLLLSPSLEVLYLFFFS